MVWSSPMTEEEAQTRFKLSEELTASAAARRPKGPAQGEEPMSAQLKNYLLTQFLKNGARLCSAYDVDQCQLCEESDVCGNKHLCAVAELAVAGPRSLAGYFVLYPRSSAEGEG